MAETRGKSMFGFSRAKISSALIFVLGVSLMGANPAHAAGSEPNVLPPILFGIQYNVAIYDVGTSGDIISNALLVTQGAEQVGDELPAGFTLLSGGSLQGTTTDTDYIANSAHGGSICVTYDVTDGTTQEISNHARCYQLQLQFPESALTLPASLTAESSGMTLGQIDNATGITSNASDFLHLTLYATSGTLTWVSGCSCSPVNNTSIDTPSNLLQFDGSVNGLSDTLRDLVWTADPGSFGGTLYGAVTHDYGAFDPVTRTYYFSDSSELPKDRDEVIGYINSNYGATYHLAAPTVQSQADLIKSVLRTDAWIAGAYDSGNQAWAWDQGPATNAFAQLDGSGPNFTDWRSGEPNGAGANTCLAYTHVSNETIFGWDDVNCLDGIPAWIVARPTWDGMNTMPGTETFPAAVAQSTVLGQEPPAGPYVATSSGEAFLRGHYVEVGVGENGHFGTTGDAPAGFHPIDPHQSAPDAPTAFGRRLGFVSDRQKDGWGVGYDDGDFFVPGTPFEGWGLKVNGTNYFNDHMTSDIGVAGGESAALSDRVVSTWISDTQDMSHPERNGLEVKQQTTVLYSGQSLDVEVTLTNTSSNPIPDIYYSRQVDPDNGVAQLCGSEGGDEFATVNTVVAQAATSGISLVRSTSPDQAPWCSRADFDQMLGDQGGTYLGLFSTDTRSTVGVQDLGFTATDASEWTNAPNADFFRGCNGGDGPGPGPESLFVSNRVGTEIDCDSGIGIGFDVGTLQGGASTTLKFSYILSADQAQTTIDNNIGDLVPPVIVGNQTRLAGEYNVALTGGDSIFTLASGSVDYYSVSPRLPTGLTLDPATGIITGTPTTSITLNPYTLTAHNLAGSSSVDFSLSITGLPLEWMDSELATMYADVQYLDYVVALGESDVTYSLKPGTSLPAGLTLDPDMGQVYGTPTQTGLYDFTIYATTATGQIGARFRGSVVSGDVSKPKLTSGGYSSCVINSDRSLSCIGGDPRNVFMQGNSADWFINDTDILAASQVPLVAGLIDVSIENDFACGRDDRGLALCWSGEASPNMGALGMGTDETDVEPYRTLHVFDLDADGNAFNGVTQIDTTPNFSCAIANATDGVSTNQVDCWGTSEFVSTLPTPLVLGGTPLVDIASIKLMGLSNNSEYGGAICFVRLNGEAGCESLSGHTFVYWSAVGGVKEFATAENSVCAMLTNGDTQCWNVAGNSSTVTSSWEFASIPGLVDVQSIAVTTGTDQNTYCAVLGDATANQLGQSNTGGTVSCWGATITGESQFLTIPRKIAGLHDVIQLSAGVAHVCAMTVAYDISCMGQNFTGIVPTNPFVWNDAPIRVGDAANGVFTTAAGRVQNLNVESFDGMAHVTWDEPQSDGNSPIISYLVYFLDGNGFPFFMGNTCYVSASLGEPKDCAFDLPDPGQKYQALVFAINGEGSNQPTRSDLLTVPSDGGGGGGVTQPTETPDFDFDLVPVTPGAHTGSVMMSVSGASVPNANGVVVEVVCDCVFNGSTYWYDTDVSSDFEFELSTLPVGTELNLRLAYTVNGTTAANANYTSVSSTILLQPYKLAKVTGVVVTQLPGTPTDTVGMASVDFTKPALPTGAQYDAFTVEARPRTSGHETITVVSGSNPVVLSGLAIGVAYDYKVKAISYDAGSSDWTSATRATLVATPKYTPVLPTIAAKVKPAKTVKIAAFTSQKLAVQVVTKTKAVCTVAPIKVKKKTTGYLVKAAKLQKKKKSAICSILVSVTGNDTYNSIVKQQVNILVK